MYPTDIYVLITPTFTGSQKTHLMYVCLIHLACRTCDEFICRRHSSSCCTLWALGTAREDLTAKSKTSGPCLHIFIFADPQSLAAGFIYKYQVHFSNMWLHGENWSYF